jgi:hypothetical protein
MPIPAYASPAGRRTKWSERARVRLDITMPSPNPPTFPNQVDWWLVVEYTDDSLQWLPVRGYEEVRTWANLTIYDYEAQPQVVRQYRVSVGVRLNTGDVLVSEPSLPAMAVMHLRTVWIKDVFNPSVNFTVPVDPKWQTVVTNISRRVVKPLGRSKPAVVSGVGRYDEFALQFTSVGDVPWDKLQALTAADRTYLVQTPKTQWYCQVTDNPARDEDMFSVSEETVRKVTIAFTEVEPV